MKARIKNKSSAAPNPIPETKKKIEITKKELVKKSEIIKKPTGEIKPKKVLIQKA